MKIASLFLTFSLLILGRDIFAQTISKQEKQLLRSVEKNYEESVKFLENTVNTNSGTHNLEGVKKVGMIYKAELEKQFPSLARMSVTANRGGTNSAEADLSTLRGLKAEVLLPPNLSAICSRRHRVSWNWSPNLMNCNGNATCSKRTTAT